jgi:hypothetical protein
VNEDARQPGAGVRDPRQRTFPAMTIMTSWIISVARRTGASALTDPAMKSSCRNAAGAMRVCVAVPVDGRCDVANDSTQRARTKLGTREMSSLSKAIRVPHVAPAVVRAHPLQAPQQGTRATSPNPRSRWKSSRLPLHWCRCGGRTEPPIPGELQRVPASGSRCAAAIQGRE